MIWSQFDKFKIRNAVLCLVGGIWSKLLSRWTPPCFIIKDNNMQIFPHLYVKTRENKKIGMKESLVNLSLKGK